MATSARNRLRIGAHGRVVIPAAIRAEMGVDVGDELVAFLDEGRLIMSTREHVRRELRELMVTSGGDPIGELIAERRAEAMHEDEDVPS